MKNLPLVDVIIFQIYVIDSADRKRFDETAVVSTYHYSLLIVLVHVLSWQGDWVKNC